MLQLLNKRILIAAGILIIISLLVGSGYYFYHKGIQDSTIPLQPIAKVDLFDILMIPCLIVALSMFTLHYKQLKRMI